MDIYYFYNGINNIINLVSKNEKYLNYYELILNDPLVILDFKDYKKLKGGSGLISKGAKMFGKKGLNGNLSGIGSKITETLGLNDSGNKKDNDSNNSNNSNNSNETESTKEKVLNILKILFLIGYYLCLFSILPLIPFIAISYYSFKRLKIFYNNQMSTL